MKAHIIMRFEGLGIVPYKGVSIEVEVDVFSSALQTFVLPPPQTSFSGITNNQDKFRFKDKEHFPR